jgi:glycosyltransferase involved in cell wall biosynthesis
MGACQASIAALRTDRKHPSLPNSVVVEHMRRAHIGLLPTYAETFGYSVLEFQAAGCPVVSTDVRALPEINSEECGWLISVPRNRLGEALYTTPDARQDLSTAIEAGLERAVHEIFTNLSGIEVKGAAALSRIEKAHSPDDFARQMQRIYSPACSQS